MDEVHQMSLPAHVHTSSSNNNSVLGSNNNNNNRKHHLSDGAARNSQQPLHQHLCAGCTLPIRDRYLLQALDAYWHEDCLKCSCCGCRLGEVGSNLFAKANLILCKRDYLRLFGATGSCSACAKPIPAFEMVMRAKSNVYHLDCFACQQCHQRFCVGDRFYLCDNQILCEYDYEERALFGNNGSSLNPLAGQNGGAASPTFVVFQQRPSPQELVHLKAGHQRVASGQQLDDQQQLHQGLVPLTSSASCLSPGSGASGQNNQAQPQQQQHEQGDASSSGYGSPDSAGGLIDEG